MQTEKEFKELAQALIQDNWSDEYLSDYDLELIMNLMWNSYNNGKKDNQK